MCLYLPLKGGEREIERDPWSTSDMVGGKWGSISMCWAGLGCVSPSGGISPAEWVAMLSDSGVAQLLISSQLSIQLS